MLAILTILFGRDDTTAGSTSVQFWVMLSAMLLLDKFLVGSLGPFISKRRFTPPTIQLLNILNFYTVNYTLGLMSPSPSSDLGATTVNDFFQVWAVLIVTMQDNVNMGRPYRPKEMTLVELVSSLWSANKLRKQRRPRLMVPLWVIWTIHASRVIWQYFYSSRAMETHLDKIKIVSDYMMTSPHTGDDASPDNMSGYRYIVAGEERQAIKVEQPATGAIHVEPGQLLTLDQVWEQAQDTGDRLLGAAADTDSRFKDVCLSFALYKLQRRRFYNFPIAEATHRGTPLLVSGAILKEGANSDCERALRITELELSFLHDYSYSKHAAVFARGFPYIKLLLSLFMVAGALYLSYAVRDIPSIGTAVTGKEKVARITHGVLVTRFVIAIIVYRELVEVRIYALSQWTKVLIVCHYVRLKLAVAKLRRQAQDEGTEPSPSILASLKVKCFVTEMLARMAFFFIKRGRWDQRVDQYNLLMAMLPSGNRVRVGVRALFSRKVKLQSEVKTVLFRSLKDLAGKIPSPPPPGMESVWARTMNSLQSSYLRNAFADESSGLLFTDPAGESFKGDTNKILVWHIATGLCQIKLLDEDGRRGANLYTLPKPSCGGLAAHYDTAVTLSNYCTYLVREALVPDNGIVNNKVFRAVCREVLHALRGCRTLREVRDQLLACGTARDNNSGRTIHQIGVQLSETLMSTYPRNDDLWERLAKFWAGFLLYLSASTRTAKHQIHLEGRGELTTHLWVLLSHAGFLGKTSHGEQMLDPVDLNDAFPG